MIQRDGRETSTPGMATPSASGAHHVVADTPGASVIVRHAPLLIVLSGPSAVGKTTLARALVAQGWPGYVMVTVTTRRKRLGEVDGVHYHFRTEEQFQEMIARDELIERAEVHGNWYGIPAAPLRERLAAGQDVLLSIDPQGAQTIRTRTKGGVYIFLSPESLNELVARLDARNLDSPEQRTLRLLNAEREMAQMDRYDYVIINRQGQFEAAVEQIKAIITAEHCRVNPRQIEV
ncbi:MAG TPA: guanylate kinase [Ktedonobacterales bacterium]|nr:guanylate kinase [Ktedonobacterales bacterium]